MSTPVNNDLPPDLSPRSRSVAVVAWSGFLVAAIATMICFALLDPAAIADGGLPEWWSDRLTVYAIGFFFFLLVGLSSAAMAVYLVRTEAGR
ncbi:MAG TPA: hypothetical protein P5528_15200 [Steroidobacteraceae bacterium]|nr:hypothetical protein [Steroidobacteraceae bacterium]HRX90785.1 hypothetical protein [Steroidobacteraceae bacterium]